MADFSRSSLHQFPQPTRPAACSIDLNPESSLPEYRFPQELHHSEAVVQLPQPSRPIQNPNFYASELKLPPQFPGHNYSLSSESTSFESNASEDNILRYPPPSSGRCTTSETTFPPPSEPTPKAEVEAVDELLQILVECLEELRTKSREMLLRKFFSEIEKEASLERFIIERLKHSKAPVISELLEKLPENLEGQVNSDEIYVDNSMPTRSIYESCDELSQKLEKFKVKTLDLGGDSEEENRLEKFKVKTLDLGGFVDEVKK